MKWIFKGSDGPEPPPLERTAALLKKIYYFMAFIAFTHAVVFTIFLIVFALSVRTMNYYSGYLEEPMSGPNVARTVTGAFGIVSDVRNITSTAAAATSVMSSSVGLEVNPSSRNLLSVSDDAVRIAVASLINATADKVREFNASAPSDFLHWIVQTDWKTALEPKVVDMLAIARYGVASAGTMLGALGSPVDPAIVGAKNQLARQQTGHRRLW